MNQLYPLKFKPIFLGKIWGGDRISKVFGPDYPLMSNCGEAWLISGVEGQQSQVANGFLEGNDLNELVEVYLGDLVGDRVYEEYGDVFPILIKLIDSNAYLSVQVHPDDALARKRHGQNGKSELWYILDALDNSELISGFSRAVDREIFEQYLGKGSVNELLHTERVSPGDVFYTPAGRVHAIGPGVLLAEIQQTSDITYRIHDWNRVDEAGHSRELHTGLALDAIDFSPVSSAKTPYTLPHDGTTRLLESHHFTINLINTTKSLKKDYSELDSFVILQSIEGRFQLLYAGGTLPVRPGEAVLVPNTIRLVGIIPETTARLLEVYI